MDYRFVKIKKENGICRIMLNRQEKQNAFHPGLIAELNQILTQLGKDDSVQFVVLEGKGKSFCSGADLSWFSEATTLSEKENKAQFELLVKMLQRLYNLPQVTIALGKGNIFGGGIGLLSACDFVLMEESSVLAFSEVHLGLVSATILPFVATRISLQQVRKRMLTGKYFSAEEALKTGLADFVFAEGQLETELNKLLTDLQKPSSDAVLDCKKLINKVYSGEVKTDDYEVTVNTLVKRIASDEAKERIGVFLKKTKPGT